MSQKDELFTVEFDGGSRGNPGPAGIGVVVRAADATPLITFGRYIGKATNNVAEYTALITGLEKAIELGARRVLVRGDSEMIIRQMQGVYRVKNADLRDLYEQAKALAFGLDEVRYEHGLRHKNQLADKLANLAMDRRADVHDADDTSVDAPSPPEAKAGDRHTCPRCGCVIEVRQPSRQYPHQLKPFVCQCGAKMG